MDYVTVDVAQLRDKIKENRDKHRAIFEEAVEGYRKKAIELLEEHIKNIKKGKVLRVDVALPQPEDHTRDYDRILAMLDMHSDSSIDINERDFASYVLDDWSWKRQFLTTNSMYSASALDLLEEQ
jgi:hypothetical protein